MTWAQQHWLAGWKKNLAKEEHLPRVLCCFVLFSLFIKLILGIVTASSCMWGLSFFLPSLGGETPT